MSHSEFDKKAREVFDHMDDHDLAKAMQAKERIWDTMGVKTNRSKRYRGLLWFLLGILLALGSVYLGNRIFNVEPISEVPFAQKLKDQDWQLEMKEIKSAMANLEQRYGAKSALFDSISRENQKLLAQLNRLIAQSQNQEYAGVQIEYVTDTIYTTKIEKEIVEQEIIVRDTIFIEVPIVQDENDLIADLGITDTPNKTKKERDRSSKKKRPSSIQFNFNNSIEDK